MLDLGYTPHRANHHHPGSRGTSLQDLHAAFPDERACLEHVFATRFGPDNPCQSCGPTSRWTPVVERRLMRHRKCSKVIFPYAGTLLEHSRIPAQTWFYLLLHFANSHDGVNAYFALRHLGISLKAAQRMLTRIRVHLAALDDQPVIRTHNEIHLRIEPIRGARNFTHRHALNRTNILFIADGQQIHFFVVDLRRGHLLRRFLKERLSPDSHLFTDCYRTARVADKYGHSKSSLVEFRPAADLTPNDTIQSFLSYFRRGWRQQHQNVHDGSLWLYLAESRFRYNRRWRSHSTCWDMVSSFPSIQSISGLARNYSAIGHEP